MNGTELTAARPETVTQPERIRGMFGTIASRYDLANSILSGGVHHLWRSALVRWSGVRPGAKVLDCATGTGDLAFALEKAAGPQGSVIGTDFCDEMLLFARMKAADRASKARFENADATKLPFRDAEFDLTTISFGIRNVSDPVAGLREMARVTRPGGKVVVLEFGQPVIPGWAALYRFYSTVILPRLGGWVTGKADAYQYLQVSSAHFPCREGFLELARQAGGFDRLEYRSLMGGIAYIYRLERA